MSRKVQTGCYVQVFGIASKGTAALPNEECVGAPKVGFTGFPMRTDLQVSPAALSPEPHPPFCLSLFVPPLKSSQGNSSSTTAQLGLSKRDEWLVLGAWLSLADGHQTRPNVAFT
jgi:hypothetical protein